MFYFFIYFLLCSDNKKKRYKSEQTRLYDFKFVYPGHRDSLSAQLDLTVTKAESEQLARALQEEQYFELSQENKKAGTRHKQEIVEKEATIARVSIHFLPSTI